MSSNRNIHVLFSLSLFLIFVIGSFFIITYEIMGYQNIITSSKQEDELLLPLSFINTKIKSNDSYQTCEITEIDNVACLKIKTSQTTTYIYLHEGYLKELYVSNDYIPKLNEGSKLFVIDNINMSQQDGLLEFTVVKNGARKSIAIYLHGIGG